MKAARTGMWAAFRCPHSEADERMQPFALDLIMISWTKYLDIKNCAQDYVMLIAMLLAYVCLLRKSEYLDEATSDHYLRADDVWFEVEFTLGTAKLIQLTSTDRHKFDRKGMRDVMIDIRSAKNDEGG
jgi:hypothetical protein